MERLGLGRRVRVDMEDGRIVVKAAAGDQGPTASANGSALVDQIQEREKASEAAGKGKRRWPWKR